MARSLYICYFGVGEPLVQTQVIPYLRELVKGGHDLTLLTFESGEVDADSIRTSLAADGIGWQSLKYHKRPSVPATLFDIANGARFVARLARREMFDIFHSRSHVPMVMAVLGRKLSRLTHRPKLLFDIRGFFPEEYTDAGIWPENGWLYRSVKRVERWLMKEADGFVVLTNRAKEILSDQIGERPVEVIPCCVDLSRFATAGEESRVGVRQRLGIGDRYVATYVGAFGGWYLTEEIVDFFGTLKRSDPNTFALILSQSERDVIEPLLKARGYAKRDYFIKKVPAAEIPAYLSAADVAVSFIKPCFSKLASSPTKNAEYLACGLPIVVNDGIGDTTEFTLADRTGVVISEFSAKAFEDALTSLDALKSDGDLPDRSRASARVRFELEAVGGRRYLHIYSLLASGNDV